MIDTHIPMNNGSMLTPDTTERIAMTGDNMIEARMKRDDILSPSHNAHVSGINTTEYLNVMDRKPRALIV